MRWSRCNLARHHMWYCWTSLAVRVRPCSCCRGYVDSVLSFPLSYFAILADNATQKEATRLGAKHVLLRPFTEHQLASAIQRLLGISNEAAFAEMSSEDIESLGEDEFFLSVSPAMRQLRAQAELLAQTDVPGTCSWGTWKWKRHRCKTDPSALCALRIQVSASELCRDAGGSPRDRVIWQRKRTR